MPNYDLLDLTLGVGGERWTILAYADNVLDDDYKAVELPFILSNSVASLAPPPFYEFLPGQINFQGLTYGIRVMFDF